MAGRVVILGSLNVDLVARTFTLPRPGETVTASDFAQLTGGKGANQAAAAARAGAMVALHGTVGIDPFGATALDALVDEGVDVAGVARVDEPTGVALITVDHSGENQIVVVPGANAHADGGRVVWHADDIAAAVLEVPIHAVERFFTDARAAGATTVLNAAPATAEASRLLPLCDVVCVNAVEHEALGGATGGAAFVITLGAAGLRVIDADGEVRIPAHPVEVLDTVGAGDAACGALAAALADGLSLRDAAVRANAAGALAVQSFGARSAPTKSEIDALVPVGRRDGEGPTSAY